MTFLEQAQVLALHPVTISLVASLLLLWALRRGRSRVTVVATEDPLMREASEKARAAVGEMRKLFAEPGREVMVKYPLETTTGEIEHVWGVLTALTETEMTVTLITPPMGGKPKTPPPFTMPLDKLDDWHVRLPDQRIRGGFTTQAQIRIARRAGQKVPAEIEAMQSQFIDS